MPQFITSLECITGYITEYAVGYRNFNKLTHQRLNFIDVSITSYFSIINSTEQLNFIHQSKKLVTVLGNIYYD